MNSGRMCLSCGHLWVRHTTNGCWAHRAGFFAGERHRCPCRLCPAETHIAALEFLNDAWAGLEEIRQAVKGRKDGDEIYRIATRALRGRDM